MKSFNAITHAHVRVRDPREALDIHVGELGREVEAEDIRGLRGRTVGVAGGPVPARVAA